MARNRVLDKDEKYKRIMENVRKFRRERLNVGIPPGVKAARTDADLADVALWNEYGVDAPSKDIRIPARPFMRNTWDKHNEELFAREGNQLDKIYAGATTADRSLAAIGKWYSNRMKQELQSLDNPPNAPRTVERKGFNDPLIETGRMYSSINYWLDDE